MKTVRFLSLILTVLVSQMALAQRDAITEYFSDYEYDRDNSVVTISGRMFRLFTNLEVDDKEDQAIIDMLSKLDGLKIVTDLHTRDGFEDYKKAMSMLPADKFDELMMIREQDQDIKFLIREENGKIKELLMVSATRGEFTLLSIFGDIDLKQVAELSKKLDIDGLEDLERIDDN